MKYTRALSFFSCFIFTVCYSLYDEIFLTTSEVTNRVKYLYFKILFCSLCLFIRRGGGGGGGGVLIVSLL